MDDVLSDLRRLRCSSDWKKTVFGYPLLSFVQAKPLSGGRNAVFYNTFGSFVDPAELSGFGVVCVLLDANPDLNQSVSGCSLGVLFSAFRDAKQCFLWIPREFGTSWISCKTPCFFIPSLPLACTRSLAGVRATVFCNVNLNCCTQIASVELFHTISLFP